MRIPISFALLFFFALLTEAQDVDSLRRACNDQALADTMRWIACNELAWEGYMFSEPDSAFAVASRMLEEARAKRMDLYEAMAIDAIAATWYVKGQFAKALETYEGSMAIHQRTGNLKREADILTNMATMHSFLGAKDSALALYGRGLRMHEELHDSVSIANDLNSIGNIHMMRGDHKRAVDLFARSLAIQHTLGNQRGMATTIINLGVVYMNQGDYSKALEQYARAERISATLKDDHQQAKALLEMGTCHQELGDLAEAQSHFERSLALRTKLGDRHGIATAMNKVGEVQRIQGELAASIATFQSSADIAKEQGSPFNEGTALLGLGNAQFDSGRLAEALKSARAALPLAIAAEELSLHRDVLHLTYRALKELGEEREALMMLELSEVLDDSLMREENQRAVLRHEYAYAYEQQALVDSLRHQQELHAMATAHRDRRNLLAGGLFLFAVIGSAQWARMRYMARANAKVITAQQQVMALERQREAELVRTRIARDIHDDMGGAITKIGLLSSEAHRLITSDPSSATTTLARISEISKELTASLQEVVSAVDPRSDDIATVVAQARAMAARLLESSQVRAELQFTHQGAQFPVDPAFKRNLLLFMKEAVTNALKHAAATHVTVHLATDDSMFNLHVRDDGKGFDPESLSQGNGLRNMRERAAQMQARLQVHSTHGQGTRIELHGPIRLGPLLHM